MNHFDADAGNNTATLNQSSKQDLVSLATAHSASLRCLAIKNIRYYPEHTSILFSVLSSETDHQVLSEIEKSLESLATSEEIREDLLDRLHVIKNTFSEGEPALTSCNRIINLLNAN